ncbi:hypothetical protein M901_0449, partial [Bacteriovorax sp. DB6_IX]
MPAQIRILHNEFKDKYCDSDGFNPEQLSSLWNNLSALNCSTQDTDEKFCSCVNKLEVDESEQEGLKKFSEEVKNSVKTQIRKKAIMWDRKNNHGDVAQLELINYFQEIIGDKSACIDPNSNPKMKRYLKGLSRTDRKPANVKFRSLSNDEKLKHLSDLFSKRYSYDVSSYRVIQSTPIDGELDMRDPNSVASRTSGNGLDQLGRYAPAVALVGMTLQQHENSFLVNDLLLGERLSSRNKRDMLVSETTETISAEYSAFLEKPGARENKKQVLKEVLLNYVKGKCQELNREIAAIDPDSQSSKHKYEDFVEVKYSELLEENDKGNLDKLRSYFATNREEYIRGKGLDGKSNDLEVLDLKFKYNIAFCSVRSDFDLLSRNLANTVKASSDQLTELASKRVQLDDQYNELQAELENVRHFAKSCMEHENITGVECVDLLTDQVALERSLERIKAEKAVLMVQLEKAAGGKTEAAVFMTQMGFSNVAEVDTTYIDENGAFASKSNEEILTEHKEAVKRGREKARGSFLYDHMSAKAKEDHVQVLKDKLNVVSKDLSNYKDTSSSEYVLNTIEEKLERKPVEPTSQDIAKAQAIY